MSRYFLLALVASLLFASSAALDNGLARKPQMGWNSWNHFACNLNERTVRATAKTIVDSGLAKAGYQYVNLDDCWADHRDNATRVIPDAKGFPNGMFALGEYIHSLGLKFGIYSDSGFKTCAGRPGSLHHEVIDALTYAAWGVDYLKYDNCNDDGTKPEQRYPPMRDALNATGRPILFSMCEWGVDDPARWSGSVGNSWRTTGDINDSWGSMVSNLDQNDKWWNYSGPGHWNDPDMLEVGNGGMTTAEYQAHFSLWALIKSPLLIGCDVTKMSDDTLTILTNAEVIALSQDELGVQGHKVGSNKAGQEVWAGPLASGDVGVVLFNRANTTANITLGFAQHLGMNAATSVSIRDLVAHKELGTYTSTYSAVVAGHASQTLRLTLTSGGGSALKSRRFTKAVRQGAGANKRYASINEVYDEHPGMAAVLGGRRL